MNKILRNTVLSIIGIFGLTIVSCNDKDDNENENKQSIVGVWTSEPRPIYYANAPMPDVEVVAYMWYQENGNYVEADIITNTKDNQSYIELSENGKWSVENDIVTQTTNFDESSQEEFDVEVLKFKIVGETLFMTYSDEGKDVTTQLQRATIDNMQEIIAKAKKAKIQ